MNFENAKATATKNPVHTRSSGVLLVHASFEEALAHLDANAPYHNVDIAQEFDFDGVETSVVLFTYLTTAREARPNA